MDNWIWFDEAFSRGQAWLDLILLANHKDKKTIHDGNLATVKRGSKITSIRQLSLRWKWSTTKVKKFLDTLKTDEMIDYKSDNKKTVYTIVNYELYQGLDYEESNTEITQKNNRSKTEVKQKNTNNNDNNDNNVNNDNNDIVVLKFQKIIDSWNCLDKNVPEVKALNENTVRYKNLKSRVNQYGEDKVLEAIERIRDSSFLKGYVNNFVITFDWFIKPNNFIKVLEGNYKDKESDYDKITVPEFSIDDLGV